MTTIEIIDTETGIVLVNMDIPIATVIPRKGEWVKLRDYRYSVARVVHEYIPTANRGEILIRIYVDKL